MKQGRIAILKKKTKTTLYLSVALWIICRISLDLRVGTMSEYFFRNATLSAQGLKGQGCRGLFQALFH